MPGFGPSSPAGSPGSNSSSGPSLADQLKSRLEERRRSKEGPEMGLPGAGVGTGVPDRIAADVEQAVRVANETGEEGNLTLITSSD